MSFSSEMKTSLLTIPFLCATQAVTAEPLTGIDPSANLTNLMLYGAIFLIGFLLIFLLIKKIKRSSDSSQNTSDYMSLIDLKKKGLLTPEEAKNIGESLRRQLKRSEETAKRKSQQIGNAESILLHDPVVMKLQELAEANKALDELPTAVNNEFTSTINSKPMTQQNDKDPIFQPLDSPTEEQLFAVSLPPEILSMQESGLLNDDEIRNVRLRIWTKDKETTN